MTKRVEHWDSLYGRVDPTQVNWYQKHPTLSLELITSLTTTDSSIIDIGGGGSLLVDRLLDAGYRDISVLDVSKVALKSSRSRLGDRETLVNWIVSDVTRLQTERKFDLWHDRAVFHFLTDPADRSAYVAALRSSIRIGGSVILATFALDGPNHCAGLDCVRYGVDDIQGLLGDRFISRRNEMESHLTPRNELQKFCYGVFERLG